MRLEKLLDLLRSLAPEHLAEPWDRVGLAVGDPARDVRRALLCIDLTAPVLAEAVRRKASLIVSYHPPIFEPLETLTTTTRWKERIILEAVRRRIAIYSPHTALDAAEQGLNDWLCDALGPGSRAPIRPSPSAADGGYKLITFVPREGADALRAALARAGAGVIGNYTECSFEVKGEGTFRGGQGARPTVGRAGRFERVQECRIEMVVSPRKVAQVIAALREAHPYEEPAFDLYRLEPPPAPLPGAPAPGNKGTGQGRTVLLDTPLTIPQFVQRLKRHLGVESLHLAGVGPGRAKAVARVALCAGAGGSLLPEAGPVDAFVTGEMRHHDILAAAQEGTAVVLAGHDNTERPFLPVYRKRLAKRTGASVAWTVSRADRALCRLV